jgi:hypothetical protein
MEKGVVETTHVTQLLIFFNLPTWLVLVTGWDCAGKTGRYPRENREKLPDCQGETPGESGKQAAVSNK